MGGMEEPRDFPPQPGAQRPVHLHGRYAWYRERQLGYRAYSSGRRVGRWPTPQARDGPSAPKWHRRRGKARRHTEESATIARGSAGFAPLRGSPESSSPVLGVSVGAIPLNPEIPRRACLIQMRLARLVHIKGTRSRCSKCSRDSSHLASEVAAGGGNRNFVMPSLVPYGATALHFGSGEFPLRPLDAQPQA